MVSDKAQEAGSAVRRFGEEGSRGPDEVKDEPDRSTLRTAVRRLITASGNKRTQELEDTIMDVIIGDRSEDRSRVRMEN